MKGYWDEENALDLFPLCSCKNCENIKSVRVNRAKDHSVSDEIGQEVPTN